MSVDDVERSLCRHIDRCGEEIVELARSLVSIPSENLPPSGNEGACQERIIHYLTELGVECHRVDLSALAELQRHDAFLAGREYADRPNVAACLRGTGGGRSLMLSGHIDTMPVGSDPWTHPPFDACIESGRLYGRGAYDMKGGIAAMMSALRFLREAEVELSGDLHFESVVDEEHAGCNGTLANRLMGFNADAVILAEPSNLNIYVAHKGFRIVHFSLKGPSGIGFAGESLSNPVEYIGDLINCLKAFRQKRRQASIPSIYFGDPDPVPVMMPKLQAGEFSLHIPMQIPSACKLEVYWQTMPGETRQEVEAELFQFVADWLPAHTRWPKDISLEHSFSHRWMPGTAIEVDHPLVESLKGVADDLQIEADVTGAPYPCDLFVFNRYANTPGVVFGPSGGNAHAADEYVTANDLVALTKVYGVTALRWCGAERS